MMEHYRQRHTLKLESLIFQKHISEKHSTTNSGGLPSQTAQIIKQVMVYKHQEVTLSQDQGQGHKKRKLVIHSGKKRPSLSARSTHAYRSAAIITTKNI